MKHFVEKLFRERPHTKYVLLYPIYMVIFYLLERVPRRAFWVSYLPLDNKIPFVEAFVLPYELWFFLVFGTALYLYFKDPSSFVRFMQYLMTCLFVCELCWLLLPSQQLLRPAAFAQETFFNRILSGLYAVDTNTNVFPSAHVVGAFAVACAFFDSSRLRRWRLPISVLCFLMGISTVFIKQHSILDVFAGIALCLVVGIFVYGKRLISAKETLVLQETH